uniref:Uncharacterized protein n=1 Tax=Heliothis virescens TaxID=7102 RepID=A0A2A4JWM7_HELVI
MSNIGNLKPSRPPESTYTDNTNKIKPIRSKGSSTENNSEEQKYQKNLSREEILRKSDEILPGQPTTLKSKTKRTVQDKTKKITIHAMKALVSLPKNIQITTGYETNESQISAPTHIKTACSLDSSSQSSAIAESIKSYSSTASPLPQKVTSQNIMEHENTSFRIVSSSTRATYKPVFKTKQSSNSMLSDDLTNKTTISTQHENIEFNKAEFSTDSLQSSRMEVREQAARRDKVHVLQRVIRTLSTYPFYPGGTTPKKDIEPVVVVKCSGKARCLELQWMDPEDTGTKAEDQAQPDPEGPPGPPGPPGNLAEEPIQLKFRVSYAAENTHSPNELINDELLDSKSVVIDM